MLRMEQMVEEQGISECSSGCQSGWTMYLDQSYETHTTSLPFYKGGGGVGEEEVVEVEEEEEDLSMVSDASSGPPQYLEEDCINHCCLCFYDDALAAKRRRVEAGQQQQPPKQQLVEESSSFLDDTASSPLFSFSKSKNSSMDDVLEFSSCFSATHFKGKPPVQKYMGYMQASSPLKPTSSKPVCSEECEEKMR